MRTASNLIIVKGPGLQRFELHTLVFRRICNYSRYGEGLAVVPYQAFSDRVLIAK